MFLNAGMSRRLLSLGCFLLFGLGAFAAGAGLGPAPRPPLWASPVEGVGVPNLYRVEPDLFRSAQPDPEGFRTLTGLGVRTVLDLCRGQGDTELARGTSLRLLQVPMTAWWFRDGPAVQALRIVADRSNRPLLIHCHQGADRTGAILALYRVVVQGWTKEEALREMNDGGYHHSSLFRNLDRFVRDADVGALRKALGLPGASPTATAVPLLDPASLLGSPAQSTP